MITEFTQFREAIPIGTETPNGKHPRVVLISAGPGNAHDGNFYPPEVLTRDYAVFEGVKCFLNHPGRMEEQNRPEREVQIIAGWFEGVHPERDPNGNMRITADLVYTQGAAGELTDAGDEARKLCESAIAYSKRFPDKVLLGFSINAEGPSQLHPSETLMRQYESFSDGLRERTNWNVVENIERAMSVDLVTYPARGGRVLGLQEAERRMQEALRQADERERRLGMFEELRRKIDAAEETKDPRVIQDMTTAVKTYLDDEIRQLQDTDKEDTPMMPSEEMAGEDTGLATRKAKAIEDGFARYKAEPETITPTNEPKPSENPDAIADAKDEHMEPDPDEFGARSAEEAAADADGYMKYADEEETATEEVSVLKCAACGYENPLKEKPVPSVEAKETKTTEEGIMLEAARKTITDLTAKIAAMRRIKEAERMTQDKDKVVTEKERQELIALRAEKRHREKFTRAEKVCREAGNFMEPKDLMPFDETQWESLLRFGDVGQRSYGTPESPTPIVPPAAPRSARALYESMRQ